MTSATTVSEVFQQTFSSEFALLFEEIDLIVIIVNDYDNLSIESVANSSLDRTIVHAISDIEVQEESLTVQWETKHKRFLLNAKGKWLLFLILTVTSLLVGADTVSDFIRLIFGSSP